jgi:hypothetical protein
MKQLHIATLTCFLISSLSYAVSPSKICTDAAAKAGGSRLFGIEEVMAVRKAANADKAYRKAFEKYGLGAIGDSVQLEREKVRIEKKIGEGYRADVYRINGGRALKVAHEAGDAFALEVESQINDHLDENFDKYQIRTIPILSKGDKGVYLEKPLLDKHQIASEILKKGRLSKDQKAQLEALWENGKRYAEDTGIGLDLKASNLFWNGQEWVLFDTGPRTSYIPYGFTLDIPDFRTYQEIFNSDEPPAEYQGRSSIEKVIKDRKERR